MAEKEGDGKEGTEDLSKNPVIIEMGKTIKGLGMLVTQQGTAAAKMNDNLGKLIDSIKAGDLGGKPKEDPPDPDAINDLDNAALVPLVLSEVGKLIDTKFGEIGGRLDKTNQSITDDKIAGEFKRLVGTNPDLFEWSGEIKALNEKSPGLSIKQLYNLARSENEEKASEMDEKFRKDGEGDGKDVPGLLSLMPTSGVTAEDDEKLTKEEAADKAWDDTLEDFPGLAQLGEG